MPPGLAGDPLQPGAPAHRDREGGLLRDGVSRAFSGGLTENRNLASGFALISAIYKNT